MILKTEANKIYVETLSANCVYTINGFVCLGRSMYFNYAFLHQWHQYKKILTPSLELHVNTETVH